MMPLFLASTKIITQQNLEGFSMGPGSTRLVEGKYVVEAVEAQVWVQGEAGKELWLSGWG